MTLLKIAQMGHPALREPAPPSSEDDLESEDFQRAIDDMVETMRDAAGVGLAAPQVHLPERVVALEIRDTARYPDAELLDLIVAVNPVITFVGREIRTGWEGCLSIPGIRGIVRRHREVRLQGLSRDGASLDVALSGFAAVVAQHEVDHLDGRLFIDRMDDLVSLSFEAEYRRYGLGAPDVVGTSISSAPDQADDQDDCSERQH